MDSVYDGYDKKEKNMEGVFTEFTSSKCPKWKMAHGQLKNILLVSSANP